MVGTNLPFAGEALAEATALVEKAGGERAVRQQQAEQERERIPESEAYVTERATEQGERELQDALRVMNARERRAWRENGEIPDSVRERIAAERPAPETPEAESRWTDAQREHYRKTGELPAEAGESESEPSAKAPSQLGATTKPRPDDGTQRAQQESAADGLLQTLADREDPAFDAVVQALAPLKGTSLEAEQVGLIRDLASQHSGEKLASLVRTMKEPLFPASAEGYARYHVLGYALGQCSNARDVVRFMVENPDIVRGMQHATPDKIAMAVHSVSADLKFGPRIGRSTNGEKKITAAPPPPAEVGGKGTVPADEVAGAVKNDDFMAYAAAKNRRDLATKRGRAR